MKKTIFVTGGAGFIGSHLARTLAAFGHKVVVLDNLVGGSIKNLNESVKLHTINLSEQANYVDILWRTHKPDVCYHLAAYASEGRSNHIRKFIHSNNTLSTLNVINACVNHGTKLIFTSSVAVYSGQAPFDEDIRPNPIDEYGVSKYSSEQSIQIAGQQQGLEWVIIRPRNVYGPGQNLWDRSRNLFGIFCYNAMHDLPLTVFGDGSNTRSFTYIGDIIAPLINAMLVKNEIINLGSKRGYSIMEATEIFAKVSGYDRIIQTEPRHEVEDARCNISKSVSLLKFEDFTTLENGLYYMWEWARHQPPRPLDRMPILEVQINAHESLLQ